MKIFSKWVEKFTEHGLNIRQLWDYRHIPDIQSLSDNCLSKFGNIVLVGSSDFANDAVDKESFQYSGHGAGVYIWNVSANRLVLKSIDIELATGQDFK